MDLLELDFARLQQRSSCSAEPMFDPMRGFIYWNDERPSAVSSEAYDLAIDLCVYRNFTFHIAQCDISRTLLDDWENLITGLDGSYKQKWEWAQVNIPDWPGFSRIHLTAGNVRTLETELAHWLKDGYPE